MDKERGKGCVTNYTLWILCLRLSAPYDIYRDSPSCCRRTLHRVLRGSIFGGVGTCLAGGSISFCLGYSPQVRKQSLGGHR
jgi:hypothetical protein